MGWDHDLGGVFSGRAQREQSRLTLFPTTSKHLAILWKAGIAPRVKLYEIPPQFLADKAERILDFGYCLLRMKVGASRTNS